jgi:queuine tRNA-ribosyltransferase subunit QTRTD1
VTRKGLPSYLTVDNLERISEVKALHVCASHFFDRNRLYSKDAGHLHQTIGLEETNPLLILCGVRDPLDYNVNIHPSQGQGNLSVDTEAGVKSLSHEQYMEFVKQAKPDLCLTLADEVVKRSGQNRNRKALKRTSEWLQQSVLDFEESSAQSQSGEAAGAQDGEDELGSVGLVGSILTSDDLDENAKIAKAAVEVCSDSVVGYAITGLGLRESDSFRNETLRAVNSQLPKTKFRYASGSVSTPVEILQAVESGIDIVDTTFVNQLTAVGMALVFDVGDGNSSNMAGTSTSISSNMSLNLWQTEYVNDQRPLKPGCTCYACSNGFTRGYIHHLLECRELLAEMLLEMHNTHHMMAFMKTIREKINDGQFSTYMQSFQEEMNIVQQQK